MPHVEYIGSDGKPWPSATQLTRILPQEWQWAWYKSSVKNKGWQGWLDNLALSQVGMEIGSEVHSLIEGYIAKKPAQTSGKYESEQIADALYDKVNPMVRDWVAIEPHLKSETSKIHGTADAVVKLNTEDGLYILDWKTSAKASDTHAIQLAIYAKCWNEEHPDQQVSNGLIARVDKKSKTLKVNIDVYENLQQYYPVVEALRIIWSYQHDK